MITRPTPDEYLPYASTYVNMIPPGQDPFVQLKGQAALLKATLTSLSDDQALVRYAPGKWSIKESLVHIIDTERIFAYRALRIGRGDTTPLPGYDQDTYVPASNANARTLASIWNEYDAVRAATICLFDSFTPAAYEHIGSASGGPVSLRALAHIIPGHEAHHIRLFQERYMPGLV